MQKLPRGMRKGCKMGRWVGDDGWEIERRPKPLSLVLAGSLGGSDSVAAGRPVHQLN